MCHQVLQDERNQQAQAEKQQAKQLRTKWTYTLMMLEPKLGKLLSNKVKPNAMKKKCIGKQIDKKKQSQILQLSRPSNSSGGKP